MVRHLKGGAHCLSQEMVDQLLKQASIRKEPVFTCTVCHWSGVKIAQHHSRTHDMRGEQSRKNRTRLLPRRNGSEDTPHVLFAFGDLLRQHHPGGLTLTQEKVRSAAQDTHTEVGRSLLESFKKKQLYEKVRGQLRKMSR